MKVEGKQLFPAPVERVWNMFIDPVFLYRAMPGCEKMVETEPGKFDIRIDVGIAAVRGKYDGKMEIVSPQVHERYLLKGEGKGKPGFVKGEALIVFSEKDGATEVTYSGDMQIGGLIAGVGQRVMSGVTKMILGDFFKNMEKELKG